MFQVVEYNGERTVGGMARFIETGGEYGRAPPEEDYDDEVGISLTARWTRPQAPVRSRHSALIHCRRVHLYISY